MARGPRCWWRRRRWTDGLAFMDRAIAAASVMLLWMLLLRGMVVRRGIRRGADLHRGGRWMWCDLWRIISQTVVSNVQKRLRLVNGRWYVQLSAQLRWYGDIDFRNYRMRRGCLSRALNALHSNGIWNPKSSANQRLTPPIEDQTVQPFRRRLVIAWAIDHVYSIMN